MFLVKPISPKLREDRQNCDKSNWSMIYNGSRNMSSLKIVKDTKKRKKHHTIHKENKTKIQENTSDICYYDSFS